MPRSPTPSTTFSFGVATVDAERVVPESDEDAEYDRALNMLPQIADYGRQWGNVEGEYHRYQQRYLDLAAQGREDLKPEMDHLWELCQPYLHSGGSWLESYRFRFWQAVGDMQLVVGRLPLQIRKDLMDIIPERMNNQIDMSHDTTGMKLNDLIALYGLAHKEEAHDLIADVPLEESDYPEGLRGQDRWQPDAPDADQNH